MITGRGKNRAVGALLTSLYVAIGAAGFGLATNLSEGPAPAPVSQQVDTQLAGLPATKFAVDGGRIVTLGGVIRMGSPAPYLHENALHGAVGITAVNVNASGDLVITAKPPSGAQIIYASADEDETLVRLGVECGVSGGGTRNVVICYRDGKHVNAKSALYGKSGNIWFTLLMVVPLEES